MAFELESGIGGAAAGSAFGPIGAAAGFVIGGFLGGRKKKKAARKLRKQKERIRRILSFQNFQTLFNQFRPLGRENQLTSGASGERAFNVARSLGVSGTTQTGLSAPLSSAVSTLDENAASQFATNQANVTIAGQLAGEGINADLSLAQFGQDSTKLFGDVKPGELAKIGAIFRGLGKKTGPGGTPTGALSTAGVNADIADLFGPDAAQLDIASLFNTGGFNAGRPDLSGLVPQGT